MQVSKFHKKIRMRDLPQLPHDVLQALQCTCHEGCRGQNDDASEKTTDSLAKGLLVAVKSCEGYQPESAAEGSSWFVAEDGVGG